MSVTHPPYRSALVLGGARSGKSAYAQAAVEAASRRRIFIATAQAFDDEMRQRITQHQADRDGHWRTREASVDLVDAIGEEAGSDRAVLIDCLTLWLSNLMLAGHDIARETERLVVAISAAKGPLVFVSNEVGHGIVPATTLGRAFRDAQGRLNQHVARAVDVVVFLTAGCPSLLKPAPSFELTLA